MHTIASEETYSDGQLIFKEESPGDWVYIILSGAVEITKRVEGRDVVIEVLKEGEVFGELGFLGGISRTAAARAVGETTLGVIERTFLDHEFNKLSADFRSILVAVVRRFKKMIDRISECSYRKDPRLPKTLSLAYKDRQSFVKAYTANVSLGGLFIKTENPLPKEEKFQLKLQLPDIPEPMMIQCQVAWSRRPGGQGEAGPAGMGIMFMEMSPKDDQVFKRYLRELMLKKQ
jgi:uncharacterized protein (TIGR02266 family)